MRNLIALLGILLATSTLASGHDIGSKFAFDKVLDVNHNRGVFSTSISLPLPSNLLLPSIELKYHSNKMTNDGYGIGFSLSLPTVEKINGNYILTGTSDSGKLIEVESGTYRPEIDYSFTKVIKSENGWRVLLTNGLAWNLSLSGRSQSLTDSWGNVIKFEWARGVLSTVKSINKADKSVNWTVLFGYEGAQKFEKYLLDGFYTPYENITRVVTHYKGKKDRVINFNRKELSLSVSEEGSPFTIFSADYSQLKGSEKTSKDNTRNYNDKKQTAFISSKDKGGLVSTNSKVRYLDINGDGWTDKVIERSDRSLELKFNVKSGVFYTDGTIPKEYNTKETRFVDLNGDGVLDVVGCSKIDFKLSAANTVAVNNVAQSNYILSILKKMGRTTASFYDVFTQRGDTPKIYISNIDESRVGLNDIYENTALGAVDYSDKIENFTCSQYSIFKDVNRDGIVDVISGDVIFLRGRNGESKVVELNVNDIFEVNENINVNKDYLSISDIDGNEKLNIVPIVETYSSMATGHRTVVRKGKNESFYSAPVYPVIAVLKSDFGGFKKIDYRFNYGSWVVSSIMTNPIDGKKMTVSYDYGDSPILDKLTGKFIGYPKVITKTTHEDDIIPLKVQEDQFLTDMDKGVLFAGTRGRLHGLPLATIISDENSIVKFVSTNAWDFVELSDDRIHPFVEFSRNEEQHLVDDEYVTTKIKTTKKVLKDWFNVGGEQVAPKLIETQTYGDGIHSVHTDDMLTFSSYITKENAYFTDSNRLVAIKTKFQGKDRSNIQEEKTFKHDDKGNLTSECFGVRCISYTYDALGRVKVRTNSNGLIETLTYLDSTSLLASASYDDVELLYTFDPVTSDLISASNEYGVVTTINYITPGVVKKSAVNGVTRFSIDKLNLKERNVEYVTSGVRTRLFFDGLGRVLRTEKATANGLLHSGKLLLNSQGLVMAQNVPAYGAQSQKVWFEKTYDSFGREIKVKDINSNIVETTFNEDGVSRVTNSELFFETTSDAAGRVYYSNFNGEEHSYNFDSSGKLKSMGEYDNIDNDYKWSHDSYGAITKASMTNSFVDSTRHDINLSYDKQGLWIAKNNFIIESNYHGKFVSATRRNPTDLQKKFDLLESASYERGKLKKHILSSEDLKLSLEYTYDGEGRVSSFTTSLGDKQNYYYNNQGMLTNVEGDFLNLSPKYTEDQLTELTGLVDKIEYDENGNIVKVDYENGVTLERSYTPYTSQVKSIRAKDSKNNLVFSEELQRNRLNKIVKRVTNGEEEEFSYNDYYQISPEVAVDLFRFDSKTLKVMSISEKQVVWNDQNFAKLVGDSSQNFHYDRKGQITFASDDDNTFIRVNDDSYIVNGHKISRVRVGEVTLMIQIDGKSYPVVEDHLGSIKAMFSPKGELLWTRNYTLWGEKSVKLSDASKAYELEKLTVFSYARLLEIPSKYGLTRNLYWSKTRVYSAELKQWMSFDPMIMFSPNSFVSNPGNWYGLRYCNNDPMNCIDPTGYYIQRPGEEPGVHRTPGGDIVIDTGYGTDDGSDVNGGDFKQFGKWDQQGHTGEHNDVRAITYRNNQTGQVTTVPTKTLATSSKQQDLNAISNAGELDKTISKCGRTALLYGVSAGTGTLVLKYIGSGAMGLYMSSRLGGVAGKAAGSLLMNTINYTDDAIDFIDNLSSQLGGPSTDTYPTSKAGWAGDILGRAYNGVAQ